MPSQRVRNLRARREWARLPLDTVAARVGRSERWLFSLERGAFPASDETLAIIEFAIDDLSRVARGETARFGPADLKLPQRQERWRRRQFLGERIEQRRIIAIDLDD